MQVTIYDPTTRTSKTITAEMGASMIVQDLDTDMDFYIRLNTSATTVGGSAISTRVIRTLNDGAGAGGVFQLDGSALPYATFTAAIADHIRRMVEGDLVDADTAMSFS